MSLIIGLSWAQMFHPLDFTPVVSETKENNGYLPLSQTPHDTGLRRGAGPCLGVSWLRLPSEQGAEDEDPLGVETTGEWKQSPKMGVKGPLWMTAR